MLLFNATGDRDTAALLKLLLVRFWGAGGVTGFSLCWDLLWCQCGEQWGRADALCSWLYPTSIPGCKGGLRSPPPWTHIPWSHVWVLQALSPHSPATSTTPSSAPTSHKRRQ